MDKPPPTTLSSARETHLSPYPQTKTSLKFHGWHLLYEEWSEGPENITLKSTCGPGDNLDIFITGH